MNRPLRTAAVLALALAARAAAAPAAYSHSYSTAPLAVPPPPKAPYWLKEYSVAPRQESWNATLTVKSLDRDLPKVLEAISAAGGALTQEPKSFVASAANHTQQLVLVVPRGRAQALLKRWRKLGELPAPAESSPQAPVPVDEVRKKIDRLMKERVERAADLAKLPVALELEDEVLERLLLVEEVAREGGSVRVDLLVRQR
jgi:hypothetical protein